MPGEEGAYVACARGGGVCSLCQGGGVCSLCQGGGVDGQRQAGASTQPEQPAALVAVGHRRRAAYSAPSIWTASAWRLLPPVFVTRRPCLTTWAALLHLSRYVHCFPSPPLCDAMVGRLKRTRADVARCWFLLSLLGCMDRPSAKPPPPPTARASLLMNPSVPFMCLLHLHWARV